MVRLLALQSPYFGMFGEPRDGSIWWERALVEFAAQAAIHLRKKFPSIRRLHEDIVGDAIVDIAALLKNGSGHLPGNWYEMGEPPPPDIARFFGLAHTILSRRVSDQFRRYYQEWASSLESTEGGHPEAIAADVAMDIALDLRRAVGALLSIMSSLPDRDRDLLRELVSDVRTSPMNDGDRQRLRRLRIDLGQRLQARLGRGAMEIIRGI